MRFWSHHPTDIEFMAVFCKKYKLLVFFIQLGQVNLSAFFAKI